jgi:DNA repair photolyase
MTSIASSARAKVELVADLIRWPWSPSSEWAKGFLAGIFDAEGSCAGGEALRICNSDLAIIERITRCLCELRFDFAVEDPARANGVRYVRLRGGLREQLRFFHTVDPAITRKRNIEGLALKSDANLRVVAIEPLGVEMPLYDITTGTGDFIANGVVSHNCFARPTHTYLDFNAREDFEREIVVKVNLPEVLRAELRRPSWNREHVALGTNTDPYQWVEGRYKLMPEVWKALRDSDTPCSVLTKSPLLLRDLPLLAELAERVGFTANLSIPTIDEKAWRATEPHTPHPRKRLEAIRQLVDAGIPTGVLVAPLIPGVNDDPEQVEEIVGLASEAGADHIGGIALHLRGEVRDIWFDWLRAHRPDLVPRYEKLYARGAYATPAERDRLSALVSGAPRPAGRRVPQRANGARNDPAGPPPKDASQAPKHDRPGTCQESLF